MPVPSEKLSELREWLERSHVLALLAEGLPALRERIDAMRACGNRESSPPPEISRCASRAAAIFEAAVIAMREDEGPRIANVLAAATGLVSVEEAQLLVDKFLALIVRDGLEERLRRLGVRLEDEPSRRAAFVMAASVALVNGESVPAEEQVFEQLADGLDLAASDAYAVVDEARVQAWAHRGNASV